MWNNSLQAPPHETKSALRIAQLQDLHFDAIVQNNNKNRHEVNDDGDDGSVLSLHVTQNCLCRTAKGGNVSKNNVNVFQLFI